MHLSFNRLTLLTAIGCSLLAFGSLPVQAQTAPASGPTKNVSLHLVNQPIQTALRLLFTSAGLNNSIDQAVQGNVTIDVNDVSFDTALNTLLRANTPTLTYDKTGGVYHITVLQPPAPAAPTTDQTAAQTTAPVEEGVHAYRIPIDHYDAYMIAELVAGVDVGNSSSGGNQGGGGFGGGRGGRGGGQNGNSNSSVLMVPANDVLASGGSGSSQGGGFGGQGGGFGGGGGGFGGGGGGFGGGSSGGGFGGGGFGGGSSGGFGGGGFGGF